ncbi:MAG: translation termination factor GTPase eRF3 [Marteilia pararefringens]
MISDEDLFKNIDIGKAKDFTFNPSADSAEVEAKDSEKIAKVQADVTQNSEDSNAIKDIDKKLSAVSVKSTLGSADKLKLLKNPEVIVPKRRKESLIVTFIGHVDAGKSTLCGNILIMSGKVDKRIVDKYKAEASERKMDSWYLSYLMDTTEEERARGKTVSCGHGLFNTELRNYFIVDAPGHLGYITEMISGSSHADVAVLVISARLGEFESGFDKGGQTKEHVLLVRTLGVEKVVIIVNKMDSCNWDEERYNDITTKIRHYMKQFYDVKKDVYFLPGSAYQGINLITNEGKCQWYKGPSLLGLLDSLKLSERDLKSPVRIIVGEIKKDFNTISYYGKVIVGCVQDKHRLLLMPDSIYVNINNITLESDDSSDKKQTDGIAIAGDNIIFQLSADSELSPGADTNKISSGTILCAPESPANTCKKFYAELLHMSGDIMLPGFKCMMHLLNETREITFDKAIKVYDKSKKDWVKSQQPIVKAGTKIKGRFSTQEPLVLEEFDSFPALARFNLRKNEETIGIGKVILIPKKEKEML